MAARLPAVAGAANYIDPIRGLPTGVVATTETYLLNGSISNQRNNFITELYFFATIDDDDTWASGIPGIQAAFWLGDDADTDAVTGTLDDTAGTIRFETNSASGLSGWLLLFIDPSIGRRSGFTGR